MGRHERQERRERDFYRDQRPLRKKPAWGYHFRVVAILGVVIAVTLLVSRVDYKPDRVITAPGQVKLARMSPRTLLETSELNGIDGGAKAGHSALVVAEKAKPQPSEVGPKTFIVAPISDGAAGNPTVTITKPDPQHPHAAIRIVGVRSEFPHTNRTEAIQDAQRVARQKLAEVLASLDPPIYVVPSEGQIVSDYIVANSAKDAPPSQEIKDAWKVVNLDTNRQWATVDLEVSESQLRSLRAKHRLYNLGLIVGSVFGVLGLCYGALRLDAVAKNYFTKSVAPPAV